MLFRANGPLGQDLVAKDIQRGRDMGIPSYNHFRTLCGLPKATSFDDLRDVMEDEVIKKKNHLKLTYYMNLLTF